MAVCLLRSSMSEARDQHNSSSDDDDDGQTLACRRGNECRKWSRPSLLLYHADTRRASDDVQHRKHARSDIFVYHSSWQSFRCYQSAFVVSNTQARLFKDNSPTLVVFADCYPWSANCIEKCGGIIVTLPASPQYKFFPVKYCVVPSDQGASRVDCWCLMMW